MSGDASAVVAVRRWRRVLGATFATLALGTGACASQADVDQVATGTAFEATPVFLRQAAERSAATQYRLEAEVSMVMSSDRSNVEISAPIATGEQDGERSSMVMDMRPFFEEMSRIFGEPPLPGDLDMTMEIRGDATAMYMRSPMLQAIAELAESDGVPLDEIRDQMGPLVDLGDGWGRVDFTALEDQLGLAEVQSAAGGMQAGDVRELLDLVADADGVIELGDDEVRGVAVRGLAAEVSFADMVEQQGIDFDEYYAQFTGELYDDEPGEQIEAMFNSPMLIDVWVDDQGLVRRMGYEMDLVAMLGSVIEPDDQAPDQMLMNFSFDLFDFGDESIRIEMPTDWVDITDSVFAPEPAF